MVPAILAFQALEFAYIALLGAMLAGSGLVALVVVVRLVEPRGTGALVERILGRPLRRRRGRPS